MLATALFLLLTPHAAADAAIAAPCEDVRVYDAAPADAATLAPVDVRPVALFTAGCAGTSGWTLALLDEDELIESAHFGFSFQPVTTHLRLDPGGDLAPNTTYRFVVTPDDEWGEAWESTFATGDGVAAGPPAPPTIDDASATVQIDGGATSLWGWVDVTPAADPDGLGLMHLVHDGAVVATARADSPTQLWLANVGAPDEATELCFEVVQEDGAGRTSEPATECVVPDVVRIRRGPFGCTTTGGLGASAGLALLGLALVRRRRR